MTPDTRSPSPERREPALSEAKGGQGVRTYAVDRLEGKVAVLVADDGTTVDVPRNKLPSRIHEGTILRVRPDANGRPDWSSAEIDKHAEERRLREAKRTLDDLKRGDPGGDIKL